MRPEYNREEHLTKASRTAAANRLVFLAPKHHQVDMRLIENGVASRTYQRGSILFESAPIAPPEGKLLAMSPGRLCRLRPVLRHQPGCQAVSQIVDDMAVPCRRPRTEPLYSCVVQ